MKTETPRLPQETGGLADWLTSNKELASKSGTKSHFLCGVLLRDAPYDDHVPSRLTVNDTEPIGHIPSYWNSGSIAS